MDYCTECGCCPAQPGFKLCTFCEDGLPCPVRQRSAQRQQLVVTRPVLVHDATKGVKVPRLHRRRVKESASEAGNSAQAPAGDLGAAELRRGSPEQTNVAEEVAGWPAERDRYREKRKQQRKERDMATNTPTQPRYCKCKPGCTEIARSNASPYAKGHNPHLNGEAAPAANGAAKRVCACGCGTPLKSRWPYINGHGKQPPLHTRGDKRRKAQRKPVAPRKNGHAVERVAAAAAVATLCVTESHLNAYLLRLPLERKTVLVQRDLEEQLHV